MAGVTKPRNMHINHSVLQNQRVPPVFFFPLLILPGFRVSVIHFLGFGQLLPVSVCCFISNRAVQDCSFPKSLLWMYSDNHAAWRVNCGFWATEYKVGVDKYQKAASAVLLQWRWSFKIQYFSALPCCCNLLFCKWMWTQTFSAAF